VDPVALHLLLLLLKLRRLGSFSSRNERSGMVDGGGVGRDGWGEEEAGRGTIRRVCYGELKGLCRSRLIRSLTCALDNMPDDNMFLGYFKVCPSLSDPPDPMTTPGRVKTGTPRGRGRYKSPRGRRGRGGGGSGSSANTTPSLHPPERWDTIGGGEKNIDHMGSSPAVGAGAASGGLEGTDARVVRWTLWRVLADILGPFPHKAGCEDPMSCDSEASRYLSSVLYSRPQRRRTQGDGEVGRGGGVTGIIPEENGVGEGGVRSEVHGSEGEGCGGYGYSIPAGNPLGGADSMGRALGVGEGVDPMGSFGPPTASTPSGTTGPLQEEIRADGEAGERSANGSGRKRLRSILEMRSPAPEDYGRVYLDSGVDCDAIEGDEVQGTDRVEVGVDVAVEEFRGRCGWWTDTYFSGHSLGELESGLTVASARRLLATAQAGSDAGIRSVSENTPDGSGGGVIREGVKRRTSGGSYHVYGESGGVSGSREERTAVWESGGAAEGSGRTRPVRGEEVGGEEDVDEDKFGRAMLSTLLTELREEAEGGASDEEEESDGGGVSDDVDEDEDEDEDACISLSHAIGLSTEGYVCGGNQSASALTGGRVQSSSRPPPAGRNRITLLSNEDDVRDDVEGEGEYDSAVRAEEELEALREEIVKEIIRVGTESTLISAAPGALPKAPDTNALRDCTSQRHRESGWEGALSNSRKTGFYTGDDDVDCVESDFSLAQEHYYPYRQPHWPPWTHQSSLYFPKYSLPYKYIAIGPKLLEQVACQALISLHLQKNQDNLFCCRVAQLFIQHGADRVGKELLWLESNGYNFIRAVSLSSQLVNREVSAMQAPSSSFNSVTKKVFFGDGSDVPVYNPVTERRLS